MIDPELEAVLEFMPVIDLDDPVAARREFEKLIVAMRTPMPEEELLDIEDRVIPGWEGDPAVSVRVYRPKAVATEPVTAVPGILQIHGGGFIVGSVEAEHAGAVLTAAHLGAVLVSVEYRLAPEHPYPAGLHDCYAALSFLHTEARALGVDPERIALTGASAGAVWLPPPRCWPATGAVLRSASRCCTSPSSTTGSRRRRCRSSWTLRSGTGHWR